MGTPSSATVKKSKRGRPKADEIERRNSALLDAATRVFLESGFTGARMTLIAKRAGASLQTLYSRYPNKAILFQSLLERRSTALFDAIGPLGPDREVREVLLRFAAELLAMMIKPETRDLHRLIIAESIGSPDLGVTFWKAGPGRGLIVLANYLEQMRSLKKIHVVNPEHAAEVFLGFLLGGVTMRTTLGLRSTLHSRKQQLQWAEYVVDLFLSTLAK